MKRESKEIFKTYKQVFDLFTERTLWAIISAHNLDRLIGPISLGKEAVVFSAQKADEIVAVKIYRIQTCDFNRMYDYIKYDPRYLHLSKRKREIIFAWAQREYRNLHTARAAGVKVPIPHLFKNNVLVMEFVGNESAAPMLKDAPPENPEAFFKEIVKNMKKLYKAGIVHADLSAFNILNHDEKPVFIDMGQSTTLENPQADEFLERDVRNICHFFKKLKLKIEEKEIIKKIKQ